MGHFKDALAAPSDIQMHLGLLHGLACRDDVHRVVEIGFRTGLSAAAFCASGKRVTSIDKAPCEPTATRYRVAYPNFTFVQRDSLAERIPNCDLLFIDGEHTYRRVRDELEMHGSMVSRFIVLHDTETFRERGKDGSVPGLLAAVNGFLSERQETWRRLLDLPHNNGLTILERI